MADRKAKGKNNLKKKKKISDSATSNELFMYSCPLCDKDTFHPTGLKLWCEDCHTPIVEHD